MLLDSKIQKMELKLDLSELCYLVAQFVFQLIVSKV